MSFEIDWHDNFYGISWAYEKDRLVVSTVFEDKSEAIQIAQEIEEWSDKFTRLTIVEKVNGGNRTVPTLVFSDGTAMTNPSAKQVVEKMAAL